MRLNEIKDKNKRQLEERRVAVLAMEFLIGQVNDESLMDSWLMCGVADGDIDYGCTDTKEVDDYYIEEGNVRDLLDIFLRTMAKAQKDGGLYCGGVVSKEG